MSYSNSKIEFKDCDLIVGTTGILAENVSLQNNANVQPAYLLGYKKSKAIPHGNITSTINFDYTFNVVGDPFFSIINSYKQIGTTSIPIQLEFAGLEFTSYLQSFRLLIEANALAKASVSFICYQAHSGTFGSKRGIVNYNRNAHQAGHGWASFVTSSGTYLTVPTYKFEYNYLAEHVPIYILGMLNPIYVNFLNGTEEISFVRDNYITCTFSGELVKTSLLSPTSESSITIRELNSYWEPDVSKSISLNLLESQIISTNLTATQGDFVKTLVNIQEHF